MPTAKRAATVAAPPQEVWEVVSDPHHLPRWWPGVQRVEEVPFERILSAAVTEVSLQPAAEGQTRVQLKLTQRLRGLYRFGSPTVRRAARAQLDEALDGLQRAFG